ncbi:hypothetical protein BC834DRAFT_443896 [Gloeopeniophorella convolvens]|nr:hypothetical protein BC834DRAFT_443896 [Gloeopeniophorella convolvens]
MSCWTTLLDAHRRTRRRSSARVPCTPQRPATSPHRPLHRAPLSRPTLPSAVRRTHTPYSHHPRPATSTTCLCPGQAPARLRALVPMVPRTAPLAARAGGICELHLRARARTCTFGQASQRARWRAAVGTRPPGP